MPLKIDKSLEKQGKLVSLESPQSGEDWDFVGADTQYLTHGIHPYPARMIPQIASRLIDRYSTEHDLVVDPFCGSGTVLVESMLSRRRAIGNDINPLAVLIARVKTTPIEPTKLDKIVPEVLYRLETEINLFRSGKISVNITTFPNIEHWFKKNVIEDLAFIKHVIEDVADEEVKSLLKVCFSHTVIKVSNVYRSGDTFIKRLSAEDLKNHRPNTLVVFKEVTTAVTRKIKELWARFPSDWKSFNISVISHDAKNLPLENDICDLVLTSPPYGEEKNTISYTRWSKLSLLWLGYTSEELRTREKATLGARNQNYHVPSQTLASILEKVEKENERLVKDARTFFADFYLCVREMHRILRDDGYCAIVIGNRSLKRRKIPMDIVCKELCDELGFSHVATYYRKIPIKSIPWTVAKGETISAENILVFRK